MVIKAHRRRCQGEREDKSRNMTTIIEFEAHVARNEGKNA